MPRPGRMKNISPLRHWPLIIAVVFTWAVCSVLAIRCIHRYGIFVYALDDAYIEMSTAANTARFGVWGVTRHDFSFAASSPLYTTLLAVADRIAGVHDITPLAFNFLFAAGLCLVCYALLLR